VKTRFQNVPFKRSLHRYDAAQPDVALRLFLEVGLYKLNPADP
jgi:hypothetical protein